jgi:hypothetical protein
MLWPARLLYSLGMPVSAFNNGSAIIADLMMRGNDVY